MTRRRKDPKPRDPDRVFWFWLVVFMGVVAVIGHVFDTQPTRPGIPLGPQQ